MVGGSAVQLLPQGGITVILVRQIDRSTCTPVLVHAVFIRCELHQDNLTCGNIHVVCRTTVRACGKVNIDLGPNTTAKGICVEGDAARSAAGVAI